MTLFPHRIERIEERLPSVADVSVPHGAFADYVVDSQGREWVRKKAINTGFQPLLAEAFGLLFGNAMNVRMPQGAVQIHDGESAWLSCRIEAVTHWDANKIPFIDNLHELGPMLALDALLANHDRHRGNILLQSVGADRSALEIWVIDMGNALVGWPSDFLDIGLDIPDPRNLAPGIPVVNLERAAMEAAQSARDIDTTHIAEYCREACELVNEGAVDRYTDVLQRRCEHAEELVERYLQTILDAR